MGRTLDTNIKAGVDAKRLLSVLNDFEGRQQDLAKVLGISQAQLSKMVNGVRQINLKVVRGVCYKLGYAPEWFIKGTGPKKRKPDDVKLITEISMLRTEMDIMLHMNEKLHARMQAYELELNELKNTK